MILWRLSGARYARAFDGGYGLIYDGRWNSAGYGTNPDSTTRVEGMGHLWSVGYKRTF